MTKFKAFMKYLLGAFFIGAGVMHFVRPEFYLKIMPPALPWHLGLVYLSGLAEILLGILVVIPKYTRLAAWGLIVLLIAIFPANIYLAMNPQIMPDVNPLAHLIRLPIQLVFIAWAWWFTRTERRNFN
jgi:uncharacterized membrane protein